MHVAGIEDNTPRQLLSNTCRPLVSVGLTYSPINGEPSGRRQRPLKCGVIHIRLGWCKCINEIFHTVEGSIYVTNLPGCGIVVNSIAPANYGMAIAPRIVGKTDTRT